MPGSAENNRGDINGYSWLRDQSTGVGRSHELCGSGSKKVYIRSNSDSYDEGTESATISFAVDRVLDDDQWDRVSSVSVTPGTLTITNDGPMPAEYLMRSGHLTASHVVDAVSERARVVGDEKANDLNDALALVMGNLPDEGGEDEFKDAILGGAASTLVGPGGVTTWARTSRGSFSASPGDNFNVSGDQVHATVGLDGTFKSYAVGAAVTFVDGDGSYTSVHDSGRVENTLWAWTPYAIWSPNDRLSIWGTIGYGVGSVTLDPTHTVSMDADTEWVLAAVGLRRRVTEGLDLVSDAFWQEIDSEDTDELDGSSSDTSRVRVGLEGRFGVYDITVTPSAHIVHEGGDIGDDTVVDAGLGLSGTWDKLTATAQGTTSFGSASSWETLSIGVSYRTRFGSPRVGFQDGYMILGHSLSLFDNLMFDVEGQPNAESIHGRVTYRW